MTDVFLPLSVGIASIRHRYVDSTGVSTNPYNGVVRTANRGGDRIGVSLEFNTVGGLSTAARAKRRKLISTLMAQRGRSNRLVLMDPGYTRAGSFPASELLSNTGFESTTGWTGQNATLSVQEGVLRSKPSWAGASPGPYASWSATQYVPYVGRGFAATRYAGSKSVYIDDSANSASVSSSSMGELRTVAMVARSTATGVFIPAYIADATGWTTADYLDIHYASVSRCALADNAPNLLLQSQTFGTTWSPANVTVVADQTAGPDGTVTADYLREVDTSNMEHYIQQGVTVPSAANEFSASVSIKTVTRGWAILRMNETAANSYAYACVNLSTGALGTVGTAGANWSNARAHVVAQGNGWYRVTITARKTNAATTIQTIVNSATADNDFDYAGTASQDAIALWGASLSQSAVPIRYAATTTTASTGTAQAGSLLHLKGLPVSTDGLLLAGDWVEVVTSIGSQLSMVTAPLDSDASGLGTLHLAPPIRGTTADNAAVIIHNPMGRFILASDVINFDTQPGIFSTSSVELEESST